MVKKAVARKKVPAKGLKGPESGKRAEEGAATKRLKPSECRKFMRKELAMQFPEILKGFVGEAKAGSCAHLKLTNELLQAPVGVSRKKGSAERMLETLSKKRPGDWYRQRGKFAAKPGRDGDAGGGSEQGAPHPL